MNVCGIKSKLLNPDFCELITKYDILVFTETKTDKFDILELPTGYDYFAKNRSKFSKKSGGIIVIFREVLKIFFGVYPNRLRICSLAKHFKRFILN